MTRSCSAVGCSTRDTVLSRERGLSFHQFPTDTIQRSKWIRAVNRMDPRSKKIWIPGPGAMLCSKHFQESDFESYGIRRKLKKGAVPSVSLYKNNSKPSQIINILHWLLESFQKLSIMLLFLYGSHHQKTCVHCPGDYTFLKIRNYYLFFHT
uniref:THAP domain containing 9 n=1 Tax=Ovis aries TaxID=9940 RepID=A0AC11ECP2_SHEEP